jgi:dihydropteroate synthase
MLEVVAKYNVPYIMMHMRGTPQTIKYDGLQRYRQEILFFIFRENP